MTQAKIYSWLHENYFEDEKEHVLGHDLICAWKENFGDKKAVGGYVSRSFPSVKKLRLRRPDDWTKFYSVYKGLGKRICITEEKVMTLKRISSHLPNKFFVLENNEHLLRFGMPTYLQCNGNRVIMEVELSDVGQLDIFMGGKSVIAHSGICNEVSMNRVSIDGLLASLSAVRFCEGFVHKTLPSRKMEKIVIQKNSDGEYVVYSTSCKKILHFNSLNSTKACANCRTMVKVMLKVATPVPIMEDDHDHEPTCIYLDFPKEIGISELTNAASSQCDEVMSILKDKAPYLSLSQLNLIQSQIYNLNVDDKHTRRWNSDIIELSLCLWTRSPKTYRQLIKSGNLILPSIPTLARYKVKQHIEPNNHP